MQKVWGAGIGLLLVTGIGAQIRNLKPGFNLFSPQQDVQLGQEAKAQVEKTQQILNDSRVTGYLTQLGQRLAQSPKAGTFPFS